MTGSPGEDGAEGVYSAKWTGELDEEKADTVTDGPPPVTGYILNLKTPKFRAEIDEAGHTKMALGMLKIRALGAPVVGDAVDLYHC